MRARVRAKRNGIEFSIDEGDVHIPEYCPILEIKLGPVRVTNKEKDFSPSLDRIDTTKGYIKNNVAVISWRANRYKSNMTQDDISRLYKYAVPS